MLRAEQRSLEANLKKRALAIREQELGFYTDNFMAIAGQGSLIAGFAFNGFLFTVASAAKPGFFALFVVLIASMGLSFIAVVRSTFISMFAPGLALHGPDGSMEVAVAGMAGARAWTFRCFVGGLVGLLVSLAILCALVFEAAWKQVVVVAMLAGFLGLVLWYVRDIQRQFAIRDGEEVAGTMLLGGGAFDAEAGQALAQ